MFDRPTALSVRSHLGFHRRDMIAGDQESRHRPCLHSVFRKPLQRAATKVYRTLNTERFRSEEGKRGLEIWMTRGQNFELGRESRDNTLREE